MITHTTFTNLCATVDEDGVLFDGDEATPPPGTGCANFALTCAAQDGWTIGQASGTTTEPVVHNTIWYSFEAPASGAVELVASFTDQSAFNTQMALWDVTGTTNDYFSYSLLAANDGAGGLGGNPGPLFSAYIDPEAQCVTPGETYFSCSGTASRTGTANVGDVPTCWCECLIYIIHSWIK